MNSVILQIASRYVRSLMVIFAVIILLRGHNLPGGGFIGGLLAGLSIIYKGYAWSAEKAENELRLSPKGFMVTGLLLIMASMVPSVIMGADLMTGAWVTLSVPLLGSTKIGSPLLFDTGVFFAVTGVVLLFLFSLKEDS